jgi:hypothetical protein
MAVSGTNAQDIQSIALGKRLPMSALGHKQTFAPQQAMSALPPKADGSEKQMSALCVGLDFIGV